MAPEMTQVCDAYSEPFIFKSDWRLFVISFINAYRDQKIHFRWRRVVVLSVVRLIDRMKNLENKKQMRETWRVVYRFRSKLYTDTYASEEKCDKATQTTKI